MAGASSEKAAGLALMGAAAAAMVIANSPLAGAYDALLHTKVGPPLPGYGVLDVGHWVSEALMAIFFLLVGLEVKREWYEGQLDRPDKRRLPIVAAIAGMAAPALMFLLVTGFDPALARGWAIPAATDIAFALGVLALLGNRVPPSLKLLLVTIAVVDDVLAVAVIALAYTAKIDLVALGAALAVLGVMATMGMLGVRRLWPYLLCLPLLWLAVLASGIHATLAGVVGALAIPLARGETHSPLRHLEHAIHPWVMFLVVPLFGLASAGVTIGSPAALFQPLPLAVALGLFVGKQIGIFLAIRAAVASGLAAMPAALTWRHLYGAALLCGVGFTMSLFIGALAFEAQAMTGAAKLGTLAGSLLSALAGFAVLRTAAPRTALPEDEAEERHLFAGDEARDHRA